MAESDDEDILYAHDLGRNLIGGERVKNMDDVMNGGKKDKRKLRKTLALCLAFLCLGLCLSILGPTLLSLKDHLHTTLPKISLVFAGRSVGYLSGAILGGMLFEAFNPLFLLAIVLLLCGIGITLAPFATTVLVLGMCISTVGISMGVLDTGANLVCLRMWGKKRSGTMLQALHFSFALGAFFSPLLAAPFLVDTSTTGNMVATPSTLVPPTVTVTMTEATHTMVNEKFTSSKPDDVTTGVKPDDDTSNNNPNDDKTDTTKKKRDGRSTNVKSDNGSTDVKPNNGSTDVKSDNGSTDEKSNNGSTDVKSNNGSTDVKSDNGSTDVKSDDGSTDVKSNNGSTDVKSNNGSTDVKSDNGSTDVKSDDSSTNENDGNTENDDESKNANIISSNELTSSLHQVPRFAIPYIIIGIFVLITSVLFFYFLFTKPKDEPKYVGSEDSGAASDNFPFKTRVLLLLFCFYFLYVGGEVAYGSFVPMFASKSPHQFGQDRASHVAALFWGTFTLGRGLAICLASVVSPLKMVIADMVGCVTTSVILTLFADTNENVLWLGSALLGLSMASLFPTGIAWLETYTRVTGNTASFLVIGSALGEMCVPVVIGYLFEDIIGPMVLMYWMLATSALSALIFAYVMWLMMENGKEKESLPAEKSPALDLLHSVEEAFPGEEFFSNGTSSSKQMSKPLVPPILKKKDHRE